ncbi:hypothetical protein FQN51_005893 [Onygenales sp. PD_10]|nr:hypothetical protein FQN51_005893 [Onygenales sp. PD_10]
MSTQGGSRILTPADSGGPSTPPPSLPEGWLAQWEGVNRKWYYVQRATGRSQWEVPTEPFIPTPSSTPQSVASPGPYHPPARGSLPPHDEATNELRNLRGGNNWGSPGANYSANTPFGDSQSSSQTATGTQNTPVGGQSARSSSQGILEQVASDLANRVASQNTDGMSTQHPADQNQFSFSAAQSSTYPNAQAPYPQGSTTQFQHPSQAYPNQQDQGNVQMHDTPPNTMSHYPPQQDQAMHRAPDVDMSGTRYNSGQSATLAPSPDTQYHYHPAHDQSGSRQRPPDGYADGQHQAGEFPPRQDPLPDGTIMLIEPDGNVPPPFPPPYRGNPRQNRRDLTTPPRNYPPSSGSRYNSHSAHQPPRPQYANSHTPPASMPQNQPPYRAQDPYQHSMPPPHQNTGHNPNMYGNHPEYRYEQYDQRGEPPGPEYGYQNPYDSQPGQGYLGMERQTSQGNRPSPHYPSHQQQHYGGGYGR